MQRQNNYGRRHWGSPMFNSINNKQFIWRTKQWSYAVYRRVHNLYCCVQLVLLLLVLLNVGRGHIHVGRGHAHYEHGGRGYVHGGRGYVHGARGYVHSGQGYTEGLVILGQHDGMLTTTWYGNNTSVLQLLRPENKTFSCGNIKQCCGYGILKTGSGSKSDQIKKINIHFGKKIKKIICSFPQKHSR